MTCKTKSKTNSKKTLSLGNAIDNKIYFKLPEDIKQMICEIIIEKLYIPRTNLLNTNDLCLEDGLQLSLTGSQFVTRKNISRLT